MLESARDAFSHLSLIGKCAGNLSILKASSAISIGASALIWRLCRPRPVSMWFILPLLPSKRVCHSPKLEQCLPLTQNHRLFAKLRVDSILIKSTLVIGTTKSDMFFDSQWFVSNWPPDGGDERSCFELASARPRNSRLRNSSPAPTKPVQSQLADDAALRNLAYSYVGQLTIEQWCHRARSARRLTPVVPVLM